MKSKKDESFVAAPVVSGAKHCFAQQKHGRKGLRNKLIDSLTSTSSIHPGEDALKYYEANLAPHDPIRQYQEALLHTHKREFTNWLWMLQLNFNLLLFGFGSKSLLLREFAMQLTGEDVLFIDGSKKLPQPGHCLLEMITTSFLNLPREFCTAFSDISVAAKCVSERLTIHYGRNLRNRSNESVGGGIGMVNGCTSFDETLSTVGEDDKSLSSMSTALHAAVVNPTEDMLNPIEIHSSYQHRPKRSKSSRDTASSTKAPDPRWGKRYAHAQARLYILLDGIDSECWANVEGQDVLATLASSPSVSLIATANHINAPLLWDSLRLSQLRWTYHHVPTFQSFAISLDSAVRPRHKSPQITATAFQYVLQSLTPRHQELLGLIARKVVERQQALEAASAEAASLGKRSEATSEQQMNKKAKKLKDPIESDGAKQKKRLSSKLLARMDTAIPLSELLDTCMSKLICKNLLGLRQFLAELIDQRIISLAEDSSKREVVSVNLPVAMLTELLGNRSVQEKL